jgi:hypothetical protein
MSLREIFIWIGDRRNQFAASTQNLKRTPLCVAANEIDHGVRIPNLVLEPLSPIVDHRVCPELAHKGRIISCRGRNGPQTCTTGELNRISSNASGRSVNQHRAPSLELGLVKRWVGRRSAGQSLSIASTCSDCVQQHLSYLEHNPSASAAITDGAHRFLHVIQRQDAIDVWSDFSLCQQLRERIVHAHVLIRELVDPGASKVFPISSCNFESFSLSRAAFTARSRSVHAGRPCRVGSNIAPRFPPAARVVVPPSRVKSLSRLLTALNLLPSIATVVVAKDPSGGKPSTKCAITSQRCGPARLSVT